MFAAVNDTVSDGMNIAETAYALNFRGFVVDPRERGVKRRPDIADRSGEPDKLGVSGPERQQSRSANAFYQTFCEHSVAACFYLFGARRDQLKFQRRAAAVQHKDIHGYILTY